MHTDIGIRPSISSSATNIQAWMSPLATKMQQWLTSLVKKAKKAMALDLSANLIHDTILLVGVVTGAAAFGFWWGSISAGLFANFALFVLAGIYKALRQIVASLRWERERMIAANSNRNTFRAAERSERNFEVSTKAIEHLLPWVKDETSLTEESEKAYCSVVLNALAVLDPSLQSDC